MLNNFAGFVLVGGGIIEPSILTVIYSGMLTWNCSTLRVLNSFSESVLSERATGKNQLFCLTL